MTQMKSVMHVRRTVAALALAAVAGLGLTACGEADEPGAPADDALPDQADDGAADSAVKRPEGRFEREGGASAGALVSVTLGADRTYSREVLVVCITAPCNPVVESGTIRYTRSGQTRYIRFFDEDGTFVDRYAYTYSGDTLKLRQDGTRAFVTFTRAEDALPATCGGVGETRPRGGCPEGYSCNCPNGAACFVAGSCQPSTAPTCDYNDPARRYVAQSPTQCQAVRFACDTGAGETPFFDDCGCGCDVPTAPAPEVPATCGGVGERRPRGGCPEGYSCNCPNGAACFVAGTCSAVQ